MATDWMWAVAVVLSVFGWTRVMVDRKEEDMVTIRGKEYMCVDPVSGDLVRKDAGYHIISVMARPDKILQMIGRLCQDVSGYRLLWDVFQELKDNDILLLPSFARVAGLPVADRNGWEILNCLRVSGRDLIAYFRDWVAASRLDGDRRVVAERCIGSLEDYLKEDCVISDMIVVDFQGYNDPIEQPTYKWYPGKDES